MHHAPVAPARRTSWLILSIGLNVLLVVLLVSARHPAPAPVAIPAPVAAIPSHPSVHPSPVPVAKSARGNDWHSWLDDVKAAGVPDGIVAGLVTADFESRWEDQQRELQRKYESGDVDADALAQADAQHDAAREQELRAALGADGFRRWDRDRTLQDFNLAAANLSDTEKDQFYQLRKDMLRQHQELQAASQRGEIDEADLNDKLSAVQMQYEKGSKALLGDERYAAMTAAPDPGIANLKRQVRDLNVGDGQMTALVQAQQQWSGQRSQLNDDQPGYEDRLQAINAARDAAFQKILGPDGFALYQKNQDPSYQTLKRYATVWKLQDADINYLYGAMHDYNRSVEDYRARASLMESQGQAVDWDGVQKDIQAYSQQTGWTLSYYLGDDRFKRLKQNDVLRFSVDN